MAGGFDPSATLPCRMPFCRRHRRKRAIYPTPTRSLPFQPRVINSGNVARRSLTKFSGQSIPTTQAGQAIAPLGQRQQIPFTFKKTRSILAYKTFYTRQAPCLMPLGARLSLNAHVDSDAFGKTTTTTTRAMRKLYGFAVCIGMTRPLFAGSKWQ